MNHYLKFADEAEFLDAAEAAGIVTAGKVHSRSGIELDVVGEIRTLTGYDDSDPPQAQFESVPGFHVNVRGELPEAFEPFVIPAPTTPFRTWAK